MIEAANFVFEANPEIRVYMNSRLRAHNTYGNALSRLSMAATLNGVRSPVIALPDLSFSYGLPIGGVLTTDVQNGDISLNAIGNDIGCGISLSNTNIPRDLFFTNKGLNTELCHRISRRIKSTLLETKDLNLESIFKSGILGFCFDDTSEKIENSGCLPVKTGFNLDESFLDTGRKQIGTLGAGNHFVDFLECSEVYDSLAKTWGIESGKVFSMIHSGSRGIGTLVKNRYAWPDANYSTMGIFQPRAFQSEEGQAVLNLANVAENFAYANREVLRQKINGVLENLFSLFLKPKLIYDGSHNSISLEDEGETEVLVHRKGATKAYQAGHPRLTSAYFLTGNPIILPGSLGTPTYVLAPTEKVTETRNSISHGAGRKYPRGFVEAKKNRPCFSTAPENVFVNLKLRDYRTEVPAAYKDIEQVVQTLEENGLVRKVAKLNPFFAYLERGE